MPSPLNDLDRYLLITADSHAGPSPEAYGPYLAERWQGDFRGWLEQSEQMAKVMRQVMGDRSIGVDGDPDIDGDRNWDTGRRVRETEADGVVAEVIFPNTSPPFAPVMMSEFGEPETGDLYEERWAGIRAHNRWLAEFCAPFPDQLKGIAMVNVDDVQDGISELEIPAADIPPPSPRLV